MIIAVSPYHLTTREAPAMAALLLAERVVTLVPSPAIGEGSGVSPVRAKRAAAQVPTYAKFMQSWDWTEGFWRAGVLMAELEGASATRDMWDVSRQIADDEALASLRPFVKHDLYESEQQYLGAVAADLLKGGPDPGILLPVAAGIDRFACRHRMLVARATPSSVAQRAEAKLGTSAIAFAVPVLLQADAARVLHAREVLSDVLGTLRDAVTNWESASTEGSRGSPGQTVPTGSIVSAAQAYSAAFRARFEDLAEGREDDHVRLVEGIATLSLLVLPADAVLRSSVRAMEQFAMTSRRLARPEPETSPILADPWATRAFVSMIVKPLGG